MNASGAAAAMVAVTLAACATSATKPGTADAPHEYPDGPDAVYERCLSAVVEAGWAVSLADPKSRVISATTGTNLATWGDTVSIRIVESAPGRTTVHVASQTRGQLVDWGRNKRNIARFYRALEGGNDGEPAK